MEFWNYMMNTALLGTDKRSLKREEVPVELLPGFEIITESNADKEEAFLQTAALAFNFRQCGVRPLYKEEIFIQKAEPEEKVYANTLAHQVLYDIIETGSISLLKFWLKQCSTKNKIVEPELLPLLMDAGTKHKQLQLEAFACCGKRGEWLAQFNEEWKGGIALNEEELWQTGTLEQRKLVLTNIRKTDPAKARGLLQQIWMQENANTKAELLKQLAENADEADRDWLEGLLNEKSQKVKEEALDILKSIPSSSVVQQYWNGVKDSVRVVSSKGLLGIGSKAALEIKLTPTIEEAIYKTGIEKLSSQKKITDEAFIIYQLISAVPPHFWQQQLALNMEEIIRLFSKEEKHTYYIPAFGLAASRFKNPDWLRAVISAEENTLYPAVFDLLPQKEAEQYAQKFIGSTETADDIIHQLTGYATEWSIELAKAIVRHTAKNPYQYTKAFYNGIVHLLPIPIVGELEKCTPNEEHLRPMWTNLSEYISKLLTLKLQTLKAFNE